MKNSYEQVVVVCSTVSACFSCVSWMAVVKPKLDELQLYLPYEYGAIAISCLTSSLLAIRKFDDFFQNKKMRHDDVTVSDFGYGPGSILTEAERKDINKRIAHFTTAMDDAGNECWAIDDLLFRLSTPLRDFLTFLAEQCGDEDKGEYFEISETIKYLDSSLELLKS
ncbi:hypothetical protein [Hahella sp. NBU794]|uniref:hypothetical protein n=1 Tax=Hahella sp. NBU794 TaxID=3422590 RepID=UPI003D6DDD18